MRFTGKVLTYGCGATGTVMLTAVTISPTDADSNIAAWLRAIGWHSPPQSFLTSSADQVGFWIALALLTITVFGLSEWAFGTWWKKRSNSSQTGIWVSLPNAVWHLIENTQWIEGRYWEKWQEVEAAIQQELFEAAARGELRMRGRKKLNATSYTLAAASEPIPSKFWTTASAQLFYEVFAVLSPVLKRKADPLRPAVLADRSKFRDARGDFYGQVVVNRDDLLARWPKTKRIWIGRTKANPLREAFKKYVATECKSPDWKFEQNLDRLSINEPQKPN